MTCSENGFPTETIQNLFVETGIDVDLQRGGSAHASVPPIFEKRLCFTTISPEYLFGFPLNIFEKCAPVEIGSDCVT